jgi:hypothetical protein
MKEILEIINNSLFTYQLQNDSDPIIIGGQEQVASLIESFIKENYVKKEFALWLVVHSNGQDFYAGYNASNKLIWYNSVTDKQYTLDELHEYWLTNIKDK